MCNKKYKRVLLFSFIVIMIMGIFTVIYINICSKNNKSDRIDKNNKSYRVDKNNKFLILVNKDNPLPEDYEVNVKWLNNGKQCVASEIYNDLRDMLTDGTNEGLIFVVSSGYRSEEYQSELLDEAIQVNMTMKEMDYDEAYSDAIMTLAPPGTSEHSTGLALDIVSLDYQNLDDNQQYTDENKWLRKNCYKYGFILRYPKEKEDITGIEYESWHFRYVGKSVAKYITKNNLTLEEYLQGDRK